MTDNQPAQPMTAAEAALWWIAQTEEFDDPAGNSIYDEMRLNFIPKIEAEAVAAYLASDAFTEALRGFFDGPMKVRLTVLGEPVVTESAIKNLSEHLAAAMRGEQE